MLALSRAVSVDAPEDAEHVRSLLHLLLVELGKLPASTTAEIARGFKLLTEYEWPVALRLSEQNLSRGREGVEKECWLLIQESCLALGFPTELSASARAPLKGEPLAGGPKSLEALRNLIVGGILGLATFIPNARDVFRLVRSAIEALVVRSSGTITRASFVGLYEFANSDRGPKCPYVRLSVEWRRAVERLEEAYRTLTLSGSPARPGFKDYKFSRTFQFMVGEEAFKQISSIKGMGAVKAQLEELVKSAYIDMQHKLPYNGFGHFVFVGNPGLGKSEVAKSIVELLKGIGKKMAEVAEADADELQLQDLRSKVEELQEQLDRGGSSEINTELLAARSQQEALQETLKLRKEELTKQQRLKHREKILRKGRPAKNPEMEAVKANVFVGATVETLDGIVFPGNRQRAMVTKIDHNDNTLKVFFPGEGDVSGGGGGSDGSSWVKFGSLKPTTAALPPASTSIDRPGTTIRCKFTGTDNGADLKEGTLGIVLKVRGQGKLDVRMERKVGGWSFVSLEGVLKLHFEVISPAEYQQLIKDPLRRDTSAANFRFGSVLTASSGTLPKNSPWVIVTQIDHGDDTLKGILNDASISEWIPFARLQPRRDAVGNVTGQGPRPGVFCTGAAIRCIFDGQDKDVALSSGQLGLVVRKKGGDRVDVMLKEGGKFKNCTAVQERHFEVITHEELQEVLKVEDGDQLARGRPAQDEAETAVKRIIHVGAFLEHAGAPGGSKIVIVTHADHSDNTLKYLRLPEGDGGEDLGKEVLNPTEWICFSKVRVLEPSTESSSLTSEGTAIRSTFTGDDRGASLKKDCVGIVRRIKGHDIIEALVERMPGDSSLAEWVLDPGHFEVISQAELCEIFQSRGEGASQSRAAAPNEPLKFKSATGSQLLLLGPQGVDKSLQEMVEGPGGVFFVDEAYQLEPSKNQQGAQILNLIMEAMETHRKKLTVIVAGYEDEIDKLMAYNPGLRSRFGNEIKFRDYEEGELYELYSMFVERLSENRFSVAPGHEQAVAIISRRLARGAKQKNFGNGRLVRSFVEAALKRAKARLFDEPAAKRMMQLTWRDILGMCPISDLKENYPPILKLEQMIGFPQMKRQLLDILILIVDLQVAELRGERVLEVKLNQRFYGNAGTGKTSVARIYAQVLGDLGLTEKNDLYEVTPTALKGEAVGEAEKLVRSMMEAARQKVLFIDEAYELHDDSPYSKAMTDTLVSEIADTPSFRPIIVIAGYKDRMEQMLTQANQGLYRRLAPNPPLVFEGDLNEAEMTLMVSMKIAEKTETVRGELASREVVEHAVKLLMLQKQRPAFGNGGAVDNLVTSAVASMLARRGTQLLKSDFGELPVEAALDVEDSGMLTEWYASIKEQMHRAKQRGVTLRVPLAWVFAGPPGTGKRQHARQLLKMLNNLHVMSGMSFKEVSCASLIGQAVGTSVPKLMALLQEQLGGMLFINRGDRLADTPYGQEVFRQLVDVICKEEFAGKVAVVLSGDPHNLERLFDLEAAARSKLELLEFQAPSLEECTEACWRHVNALALDIQRGPQLHAAFQDALADILRSYAAAGDEESFGNFRVSETLIVACDRHFRGRPWTPAGIIEASRPLQRRSTANLRGRRGEPARCNGFAGMAMAEVSEVSVKTRLQTTLRTAQHMSSSDCQAETKLATTEAVQLEQLAKLLEEGIQEGLFSHDEAVKVAQKVDANSEDIQAELPSEVRRFLAKKGLQGEELRSQLLSMRKRMNEAQERQQTVCPICFLPEDSARQIGCPWSF